MLPAPCRWIDSGPDSFLYWHYACIAYVKPARGGAGYLVTLQWGRIEGSYPAASQAQGKRHLERWLAGQGGMPARSFPVRCLRR